MNEPTPELLNSMHRVVTILWDEGFLDDLHDDKLLHWQISDPFEYERSANLLDELSEQLKILWDWFAQEAQS